MPLKSEAMGNTNHGIAHQYLLELEKYTKKEQAQFNKEIQELEKKYGGVRNLPRLPDAIFICDLDENNLALREAVKKEIKVVAICDTNIDPTPIDYVIPANDDAVSSMHYMLEKLRERIKNAKPHDTTGTN